MKHLYNTILSIYLHKIDLVYVGVDSVLFEQLPHIVDHLEIEVWDGILKGWAETGSDSTHHTHSIILYKLWYYSINVQGILFDSKCQLTQQVASEQVKKNITCNQAHQKIPNKNRPKNDSDSLLFLSALLKLRGAANINITFNLKKALAVSLVECP